MGMFDNINYECICPVCHNKTDGFQSKDNDCMLDTLNPQDVDNFYSMCETCGCWIEFHRLNNLNFIRTVRGKDHEHIHKHEKVIHIKYKEK